MPSSDTVPGPDTANAFRKRGINPRQLIKFIVYCLLLVNWVYYIVDDWQIASHTMRQGGSLLDWMAAFAVSIDELAWFVLLFLFEMETYLLSDEAFTKTRIRVMHGTRMVCYLFLAHTLYSYAVTVADLREVEQVPEAQSLCQLVGTDVSFGSNLEYTDLQTYNCAELSKESEFFLIEDGAIVTDAPGLRIERQLTWIDLLEASTWMAILFFIELLVRLHDRGIADGPAVRMAKASKGVLYGMLWAAAAYWIYRGQYVYAWDEGLWILGFMAIDMNLSEWEQEIIEEKEADG